MRRLLGIVVMVIAALAGARPAAAQLSLSIGDYDFKANRQERLGEGHALLVGSVELERGDTKLYADEVEFFQDKDLAIARGNVVLSQPRSRIAADSAEFNTKTQLGTFHHATGIATVQPMRQAPMTGGIIVPQQSGQDTDVYFFGEVIEKQGEKKYRISNGGFSTCVQPTPRWDLTADTVVVNIDHYTFLKQAIFKVKGVPMFYMPVFYYPTQEDGRATGFLLPTYGRSTLRGQTVHTAFFWAISRSQDATVLYDYYSKTGGGGGGEYRYTRGGGADGALTVYGTNERPATYQTDAGLATSAAHTSLNVNGGANQQLPGRLQARARVNYFSSLVTNQTLFSNLTTAASNNSNYGANVVGAWRSYSLNGTFDRNQYYGAGTSTAVNGNSPKVSFSRNERPITKNSSVYVAMGGEFAHLDRQTRTDGEVTDDHSLGRLDFAPQIRYPFKKWQWFTVNTTASWRETYYTRSLNTVTATDGTTSVTIVDDNLHRGYGTAVAQAVGPVFTRVWNTPTNGYAERFKHTIEPYATLQRTTGVENYTRIVQTDSVDSPLGDTTQVAYGLNNRIYAKRKIGQSSQAQEILSLEVRQTYYSDAAQSLRDSRYSTSYAGGTPSKFSPLAAGLRVTPTQNVNGALSAEMDNRSRRLKTVSANANFNWSQSLQSNVGWSHKFFIPDLPGFDNPATLDHYLNGGASVRTRDNKYGLNTAFNFDVLHASMTQARVNAFYNSQCCGLAVEYQRTSFAGINTVIPADHKFLMSFTLAGLGNFSPFSGGMNGIPR